MKRKPFFPRTALAVAGITFVLLGLGSGYALTHFTFPGSATAAATPSSAPGAPPAGSRPVAGVTLPDFADIVARQGAAVVNISIAGSLKTAHPRVPGFPRLEQDDSWPDFFRPFKIPVPRDQPLRGQGSGFIVSPDGIVLTNAHVVANADEVTVKLTDRREFRAKVLGVDKPSDIAVLKINASNLPTVTIGEPANSRVGEWVLAIGAPFGFENSVTAGIISAKSRALPYEGVVPFLQTDVAINPGNSGGPLFNLNGEVIGVNSQIYSQSGGYQGLSFAIPIDMAMKVEKQLVSNGKVSRGRLGVLVQPVDQSLAESFKLDKPAGALVSEVERGSPADKAGMEPGDVILKFQGRDIATSSDLPPLVADLAPGTRAELQVWRKGKLQTLSVKVGELSVKSARTESADDAAPAKGKLGIAARPLTDEERRDNDLQAGLVVERIGDGPAARAGIRRGDIIVSVNGENVTSVEQLRSMVDQRGKHIALQVLRNDRKLFVPVEIG